MQRFIVDLRVFILVLCWTQPGLVSATDFSTSTLDFLAIFTGGYDNSVQYKKGFTKLAFIEFRVVPVDIPSLRPAHVWYDEWAAEGKVLHREIGIITEGPGKDIIINLYNVSEPNLFKPGEFNVSTLTDLQPEELKGGNCSGVFTRLTKAVFVGYWPDCKTIIRGNHPDYADTVTCEAVSVIVPPTVQETFSRTPYMFQRKGPRYPFPGLPDTYNNICGKNRVSPAIS